ncbi:prevent-host-death protein [Methylobacterium sp. Leaf99]|uniref:type II toxin-antitoxin system Phd/YefM family antitoxin n=1 Tax=Methylobacterium sp. Leaf99 TaxID=1736251 RepID=UPI0007007340|nr:hypothetical protein [Methylobacterium sp. Leaf99]KQP07148.1 prevent-host-death protein [Methylobacterium sp. Leaf99]
MTTILLEEAGPMLADLAKRVENGETIVVARDGKPVLDLVPHRPDETQRCTGIDWDAAYAYLRANGLDDPFPFVADDFDDPLPEDFLLRPLP